MINKIRSMPSIPHFERMNPTQYNRLFDGGEIEMTEKYDGSNVSFGVDEDGKIYVKTKKGKPITDPAIYYEMAAKFENEIFAGFGRLLDYLFNLNIERILPRNSQIFGEMFCKSRMNVIQYHDLFIGNGTVVLFGDDELTIKFKEYADNNDPGWRFMYANGILYDMNYGKYNTLNYNKILLSRKKEDAIKKAALKLEIIAYLTEAKKEVLKNITCVVSTLGGTELEGVVVRNKSNGQMAKIVDLDNFDKRRREQWAGIGELKIYRESVYKYLMDNILLNADIFIIEDKQHQKIAEAIEVRGSKFGSIEELLDVLINDAYNEIDYPLPETWLNTFWIWANNYLNTLVNKMVTTDASNAKVYTETITALRVEETKFKRLMLDVCIKQHDPFMCVVKYILGDFTLREFANRYVTA